MRTAVTILSVAVLLVGAGLPSPVAAENCLGPIPVMGRVLALDLKTGQARTVYQAKHEQFSDPAVADGVLYVGSHYELRAVDVVAGTVRWSFKGDYVVYAIKPTPKTIFVGSGSTLHAVAPATGKEQWKYESNGAISDMLLAEGLVIFGHHGGVRAVDAQTGQQRWQLPAPWHELYLGGKGTVCAWGLEKTFVGDIKKGEWLWKVDSPGNPAQGERSAINAVAGNGRLHYVADVDEKKGKVTLVAADILTRLPLWEKTIDARLGKLAFLYLREGQLLLTSEGDKSEPGGVYALDAATGKQQWHFSAGQPVARFTRPASDMASLYFTDSAAKIWAVNRTTGQLRWTHTLPAPNNSKRYYSIQTPTPMADAIYVTANELATIPAAAADPK
jgi:outer membrane protein assembly factor BamB